MQVSLPLAVWSALLAADPVNSADAAKPAVDPSKVPDVPVMEVLRRLWSSPQFEYWPHFLAGLGVLLVLLVVFLYTTRSGVIARATTKEATRQPMFYLMGLLGLALLAVNTWLPFYSLGEDVKMLKDCGLATILISGLLLALWTASTSIADEIEGKTAMTLLSKPINRRQFILGKYVGILTAVLFLVVPLTIAFLYLINYKVFYDARESSIPDMKQSVAIREVLQVIPGVILGYFEIATLAAISVAISTRVPMVVNMVVCMTIFIVGHLTPSLVAGGTQAQNTMELVLFFARVIASVLPALESFKIDGAIAKGTLTPAIYMATSALYTVVYSTMAILMAFFLFEDRDLA